MEELNAVMLLRGTESGVGFSQVWSWKSTRQAVDGATMQQETRHGLFPAALCCPRDESEGVQD